MLLLFILIFSPLLNEAAAVFEGGVMGSRGLQFSLSLDPLTASPLLESPTAISLPASRLVLSGGSSTGSLVHCTLNLSLGGAINPSNNLMLLASLSASFPGLLL
uniref:Putative secreted protein n=1 Tax=Anopheles triannulatus TaxID=58253 RepID=A0A2M4B6U0_9DIPT